ncbi:MAG TPA: GNAT family N-acetyltransferase [Steroidobacteraceae bacterium]
MIRVALSSALQAPPLAEEWELLQSKVPVSYFQSWGWVSAWRGSLPEDLDLVVFRAFDGDTLIGLGLLGRHDRRRLGWLTAHTAALLETGQPLHDALTVEHNGLLVLPEYRAEVHRQLLASLLRTGEFDDVVLSGLDAGLAEELTQAARASGFDVRLEGDKPFFTVDLQALRASNRSFLDSLSSNTRYQIKRAQRAYESLGPLTCVAASSPQEATQFFDRLVALHQPYWNSRGMPGAFGSEFQRRFHAQLIGQRFAHGEIQLLRICAGAREIGYLYGLVIQGCLYSYQSAFCYEAGPKLKPGLVSHSLAVEFCSTAGLGTYDFLAGDSQYKRSLSGHTGRMLWLRVCRPRLALRVEDFARSMVGRVRQLRRGRQPAATTPAIESS